MAIGLKMIGFGIKLKRGRYVSAQVEGYTEKTGTDGTVTYIPLVSVHTDDEDIVLPIASEQSEKKYDIGQIIDVIYIKGDNAVYMTGFPHIRLGAAVTAVGVFLMVGFVFISDFFDAQAENVIDVHKWYCFVGVLADIGLAVYVFMILAKRMRFLKNGTVAEARVGGYIIGYNTDVDPIWTFLLKTGKDTFRPVAVFTLDGKRFSMPTNRKQTKREFEIGEKIRIIYDKKQKEVYIYDNHDIAEAAVGMIAVVILAAAVFFMFNG